MIKDNAHDLKDFMRLQEISFLDGHPRIETARVKAEWLYTTRAYPIYWHHIAKNGGTFMKHLLYALDHGQVHVTRSGQHDWDQELVRPNGVALEDIRDSKHAFLILRHPFRRFLSVYFNKVYAPQGTPPAGMSKSFFKAHRINNAKDLDAKGHTENCLKLAEWGAANVLGLTEAKPNWHLVPQMHQIAQVYPLNFRALLVEDLEAQLTRVLGGIVPDMSERIAQVRRRNQSAAAVKPSEILTPELKAILKGIYGDDLKVFRAVRDYWRGQA